MVSLIIPIYGAESFLRQTLHEIDQALSQIQGESWELILVIDASPDQSLAICQEFAAMGHSYAVKITVNERNLGKGATVRRGMLIATGEYRIFNDCDLAYPITEVMKVLKALKNGASVAIASRALKDSRYIFCPENFRYLYTRHLASRILNRLIQWMFLPKYEDTQAGLKGFTAHAATFLFSQLKLDGFSFDLELLHLASKAELKIEEVPVHFYAQRVTTVAMSLEGFRMLRDIGLICFWTARGEYHFVPNSESHEKTDRACG